MSSVTGVLEIITFKYQSVWSLVHFPIHSSSLTDSNTHIFLHYPSQILYIPSPSCAPYTLQFLSPSSMYKYVRIFLLQRHRYGMCTTNDCITRALSFFKPVNEIYKLHSSCIYSFNYNFK
jgi:hypothetical protein